MCNKHKCITVMCNKNIFNALCVFVSNICDKCTDFDLIIYEDGSLNANDKDIISNIKNNTIFIKYSFSDFCYKFSLDKKIANNSNIKYYSHLNFIKFEIFNMLDRYDSVIYMDTDMLITQNIDELFYLDCDIAWRNSDNLIEKLSNFINIQGIQIQDIDPHITATTPAPNGGLIIVNKYFDYKYAYKKSVELFKNMFIVSPNLMDEIIFSLIYVKLNLRLISLDHNIYNVISTNSNYSTKIIHFLGYKVKPWANEIIQVFYRQWIDRYIDIVRKYNLEDKYSFKFKNINNKTSQYIYNIIWCKFILENNDFVIPNDLILENNFSKNYIQLNFSDNILYKIEFSFLYQKFRIRLTIKDCSHNNISSIKDKFNFDSNIYLKNNNEYVDIYTSYFECSHISKEFTKFYTITNFLRSN